MTSSFGLTVVLVGLVGAASASAQPPTTPVAVPDRLKPPANEELAVIVFALGVQTYECRERKEQAGAWEWAFVGPEAELFDQRMTRIGRHYAGPHWEALDGSKVRGSVKASAEATRAHSIPWLLLTAKSVGPDGAFSKVTSIQRVDTAGGVAPGGGCSGASTGMRVGVDYLAYYYFFAPR